MQSFAYCLSLSFLYVLKGMEKRPPLLAELHPEEYLFASLCLFKSMQKYLNSFGKTEKIHHTKLKQTIQDVYAYVALYGRIKKKFFDAEAITIICEITHFSDLKIYKFLFRNITSIRIYKKNIISPQ